MSEIKAGSTVQLKSGGPSMTVRWVEGEEAFCEWFDAKNEVKERKFLVTSLELVD